MKLLKHINWFWILVAFLVLFIGSYLVSKTIGTWYAFPAFLSNIFIFIALGMKAMNWRIK